MSILSLFVDALCSSDFDGDDWLLSVDGWSNGGWSTKSCIHGFSSRGQGFGGLGLRGDW